MLSNIFLQPNQAEQLLQFQHDPMLVFLSVGVAMAASVLALYMVQAGQRVPGRMQKHIALLCGCITLGLGIWAMHFIGMLALELPVAVHYHMGITLLSMLPGMLASWLALRLLLTEQVSTVRVISAGLLVGLGIAAMHYSGMAAMHMQAVLRYDPLRFTASLVVAVLLGIGAMLVWQRMAQRKQSSVWQHLLLPAIILGAATSGMHYVSMTAARFVGAHNQPGLSDSNDTHSLALLIAGISAVAFLLLASGSAMVRYRSMLRQIQRSESRLKAMADTAVDAVITIDGKGLVQSFNPAAERIFGWTADEVIGQNLKMLMPSPLADQHDGYLAHYQETGERRIIGKGREVLGLHRDGRHIPLRLSIGQADTPQGPIFIGFAYDLTERKRTEAQLRIAASVFDHTREGIAVIDANHLIVESNPAFSLLMGTPREQCLRAPFEDLYQNAHPAIDLRAIWQVVSAHGHWQGEINLERPGGEQWLQRLSLTAVRNEHKRLAHYVAVVSDVSLHMRPGLLLDQKGLYDALTGLPNELLLTERIVHAIPSAKRNSALIAVISIDFDHFHRVNEIHGRDVGDELLEKMSHRIRHQLRGEDTLARGKGDELVAVLCGLKDEAGLHTVLTRLEAALQQPLELDSIVIQISVSTGCALYPRDGATAESLLATARSALEKAKPASAPHSATPAAG